MLADLLAERRARAYVVSNEVGSGIVPADALTRGFETFSAASTNVWLNAPMPLVYALPAV